MSTQYHLVQSAKTASGGCSAGPRFVRACSASDLFFILFILLNKFTIDLNLALIVYKSLLWTILMYASPA
jgi:hypothetical protein